MINKKIYRNLFSLNTLILVLYNLSLFLYSYFTFIRISSFLYFYLKTNTFDNLLCNYNNIIYKFIEREIYYFHISKYFELLETFINYYNGKKCTFLQTYHHTGALIGTYLLCLSQTHLSYIFILLNSFIHTLMYLYFLFTSLKIYFKYKFIITILQITQFVVGGLFFLSNLFYTNLYSTEPNLLKIQIITTVFFISYIIGLILLFSEFYKKNKNS